MDFTQLTPEERLLAEMAVTNFRELNQACDQAPDGSVIAVAETLAVNQGREFARRSIEASLQKQTDDAQKKRRTPGPAAAD